MDSPDRRRGGDPEVGELILDSDTFQYAGAPEQQLVLWSADPDSPLYERLQMSAAQT